MQNSEQDMLLLQEKLDLLMDGLQALYLKMDRQKRMLARLEAGKGQGERGGGAV